MVMKNQEVYIKDGDSKVQKRGKMMSKASDFIVSAVNGDLMKSEDFKSTASTNDGLVQAQFTPVNKKILNHVSLVKVHFNADHDVKEFVIIQPNGNSVQFSFSNLKRNQDISDSLFVLK